MSASIEVQKVWEPSRTDLAAAELKPLWWTVTASGALAVLHVDRRHLRQIPHIKGWVGWVAEATFDGTLVVRHADGSVQHRTIEATSRHISHIALLPDASLLLVEGRSSRDDAGLWAPNAVVLSPEGEQQSAFCIGDDIDVLMTDRAGAIWAAYGDEGSYGSHPQSAAGLAGWSSRGEAVWGPEGRLPEWPLAGCAAATEDDQVWLAWYANAGKDGTFLSRIMPLTGEVVTWRSPIPSPDGVAVRGDRAILTRRRHNMPSTEVFRAELVDGSWILSDRREIEVPGRVVLRCGQGRDGHLWLRAGDVWLRIEA